MGETLSTINTGINSRRIQSKSKHTAVNTQAISSSLLKIVEFLKHL